VTTTESTTTTQSVIDRHDAYLSPNYARYPLVIESGQGCYLTDTQGQRYLDLFAGFGASLLGHCHPDLVQAVTDQASKLWHVGNLLHTEPQTRLAQAIAIHGFGGKSFFCHSGADANEAALKLARLFGKANPGPPGCPGHRYKVISAHNSFHGRSFGTMVATGQEKARQGYEPLLPGFVHVPFNDLNAVSQAIDPQTVAVLVEPIQGEGGINVPDDNYLPGLRRVCDQHNLLLICDEVWTGCGRTGRSFAYQHWGIEPDIMTLAKGVGGGLPVGVMCAKPQLAQLFNCKTHGGVRHATTLGGNCLSMAVAAAIFEVIDRDHLIQHAHDIGQHAIERLNHFARHCPAVKQVRGKGLFIGIELDPSADGAWFTDVTQVVHRCMEHQVLVNGTQRTVLRLAPPLTITKTQLDHGLDIIEKAINPT